MNQPHTTIYKESPPSKGGVIIYTLFLAILSFAWIPFNSYLNLNNVRIALAAQDFAAGEGLSRLIAQNSYLHDFPLYSIILSIFPTFGVRPELIIYLPALLAVLGCSFLAGFMASKSSGHLAGITAMSISILSFSTGMMINPNLNTILSTFLIFLGWCTWYRMSRIKNYNWLVVWTLSLFPVFLAFFSCGAMSMIYFYAPLLFMKRPLKTRSRLIQIQHLLPLTLYLVLAHTLWGQIFNHHALFFITPDKTKSFWLFFTQLIVILTPWHFIGWPIFCASFLAVERTPVFHRYIRTILVLSSILALLIHSDQQLLSPLIAVFAIGGALNYEFFVRRYYLYLKRLTLLFFKLTIPLLTWNLVVVSLHYSKYKAFPNLNHYDLVLAISSAVTAILVMLSVSILRGRLLLFSCRLAMTFAVFTGVAYSTINITQHNYNYNQFTKQTKIIPSDAIIYTTLNDSYQKELFYLRHKVKIIDKTKLLPLNTKKVYFMSNEYPPIYAAYQWTNIVKTSTPRGPITLWKGIKKPEIIEKTNEKMPSSLH
jgi:hypothetical protein